MNKSHKNKTKRYDIRKVAGRTLSLHEFPIGTHPETQDDVLVLLDKDRAGHTDLVEETMDAIKIRESLKDKLPAEYIQMVNNRHARQYNTAKLFIERAYVMLKDKFPPWQCRAIVEADLINTSGASWAKRTLWDNLPDEWKDEKRRERGRKGGLTAYINKQKKLEEEKKKQVGMLMADQETRDRVARAGGEARAEDLEGLSRSGKIGGNVRGMKYGAHPEYINTEQEFEVQSELEVTLPIDYIEKQIDELKTKYDYMLIRIDRMSGNVLSFEGVNKPKETIPA